MNWNWLFPKQEDNSTRAPVVPTGEGALDPRSDTWTFVASHAKRELARLREKNDSNRWGESDTAEIRGQIKALKKLLALGLPKADRRQLSSDED